MSNDANEQAEPMEKPASEPVPERTKDETAAAEPEAAPEAVEEPPDKKAAGPSLLVLLLRHWRLTGTALLILALIGTYVWKDVAVSRAKANIADRAAGEITRHNLSYLRLVAVPLVWMVREEMMKGNYDQINQYLARFVREPNMKEVLVVRPDGKVAAATNKKREGGPAKDLFPPETLQADTITVTTRPDGMFIVAAPVMGLNERLGVLILVAAPPEYSLQ